MVKIFGFYVRKRFGINGKVRQINPADLQTSLVYRQKKPWLQRKEALFVVQTRLLWKWIRKVLDSAL